MSSEAIFGLVGVIVGGVLTGGVEYVLERRRESRGAKASARLVHVALGDIQAFIQMSIALRKWLGEPSAMLDDRVWLEQRSNIAEAPRFDGWYPVAGAWRWVNQLKEEIALTGEGPGDDPYRTHDQDYFEVGLLIVGIALKALDAYAKTPGYSDPPEPEPTKLRRELDAIFKRASETDPSDSE